MGIRMFLRTLKRSIKLFVFMLHVMLYTLLAPNLDLIWQVLQTRWSLELTTLFRQVESHLERSTCLIQEPSLVILTSLSIKRLQAGQRLILACCCSRIIMTVVPWLYIVCYTTRCASPILKYYRNIRIIIAHNKLVNIIHKMHLFTLLLNDP